MQQCKITVYRMMYNVMGCIRIYIQRRKESDQRESGGWYVSELRHAMLASREQSRAVSGGGVPRRRTQIPLQIPHFFSLLLSLQYIPPQHEKNSCTAGSHIPSLLLSSLVLSYFVLLDGLTMYLCTFIIIYSHVCSVIHLYTCRRVIYV